MTRLRPKLTYANVMVTLLAFVVLCGGAAYGAAQLGKGSVGTRQLKANAVTGAKVRDGTLSIQDFATGQLPAGGPGPQGVPGPAGGGRGYEATGSVNYDKFSTTPSSSTVVSLPVAPAAYFATASVEAETVNGVVSTVSCRLTDGGIGAEPSWTAERSQPVRADGTSDSFTISAVFNVIGATAITLQCSKSLEASSARVTDANIVAVEIDGATHFVK